MFILKPDGSISTFTNEQGVTINREYRYLKCNSDGYVLTIYDEMPTNISIENKVAISDNVNFEMGHEFSQEVSENDELLSSYMIRQPESVKYLTKESSNLKTRSNDIESIQAQIVLSLVIGGLM